MTRYHTIPHQRLRPSRNETAAFRLGWDAARHGLDIVAAMSDSVWDEQWRQGWWAYQRSVS